MCSVMILATDHIKQGIADKQLRFWQPLKIIEVVVIYDYNPQQHSDNMSAKSLKSIIVVIV